MVQKLQPTQDLTYSVPSGLKARSPSPVIAKRDPVATDTGYAFGQLWVNKVSGNVFALGAVAAGAATWTTLGSISSTFTTISAGTFTTTTAATAITISSGNVFTGTGSNAAVGFTFTPKGAGGLTLTTGSLTISSGNLVLTAGNVTLTAGALTLTLGNETLTNGNLIFSAAGKGISLKSGADARIGQSILALGTKAVANSSVTANTRVILTRTNKNASTAIGSLEAVTNAGVGFTITALSAVAAAEVGDLSTVDWVLVESA
jgi:hypothetical protein